MLRDTSTVEFMVIFPVLEEEESCLLQVPTTPAAERLTTPSALPLVVTETAPVFLQEITLPAALVTPAAR